MIGINRNFTVIESEIIASLLANSVELMTTVTKHCPNTFIIVSRDFAKSGCPTHGLGSEWPEQCFLKSLWYDVSYQPSVHVYFMMNFATFSEIRIYCLLALTITLWSPVQGCKAVQVMFIHNILYLVLQTLYGCLLYEYNFGILFWYCL